MFDRLPERPFMLTEKAFPWEPTFPWQDAHMCEIAPMCADDLQENVLSIVRTVSFQNKK